MIEIDGLGFLYNGHKVLDEISFQIEKGTICGLFGPNGSGKTTLLKCCSGSLKYPKGSLKIGGKEVSSLRAIDLARLVSYVPQSHKPPFPFMTKEVVLMGRNPHLNTFIGPNDQDLNRTSEALRMLRILDLADRPYTMLSGGQRQLVILARALNQETPVLLLDEPASALDFKNQINLWMILRSLAKMGKTILACTHDPNHISWFCDQSVVICDGRIIAFGPPEKSLSFEVMKRLYGEMCTVNVCQGKNIVMPSERALWIDKIIED